MSEWLPIDSAPRDGTTVLLFERGMYNGATGGLVLQAAWEPSPKYTAGGFWRSPGSFMALVIPERWMPMPELPK